MKASVCVCVSRILPWAGDHCPDTRCAYILCLHLSALMMFWWLPAVAVLHLMLVGAEAFSSGLVTPACYSMVPEHSPNLPQTSQAPYSVSVSDLTYSPGGVVADLLLSGLWINSGDTMNGWYTVLLEMTLEAIGNSTVFEGFLLQARTVGGKVPVGRFTGIDTSLSQGLDCNNITNSSVSHSSAAEKTKLQAAWEAPNEPHLGDVQFSATFVRDFEQFWVQVNSSTIQASSSPQQVNFTHFNFCLLVLLGIISGIII